ncbi:nociceptin receptor-like [Pocillopora damicornis]|uniref:nociceptin receptor-like n=1 Tax=Pocillopora damicornis TaxID=46731 RepID=UPI000F550EBA|nr:nociceptin receptor-like [Pocillopora damicornis]
MKGFIITNASKDERWFEHIVTGFYIAIFVITFMTNTFLFIVFLKNKSFRDLSTYLIVQMAVADVLYLCVTCAIIVIKNLDVQLSRPMCKALLYVEGVARFASSLSLMLISLERSMSVCSPSMCYTIRKISGVKKKAFLSVFISAVILRLGVLFVACDSEKWAPGYRVAVTVATYTLPLVVELTAYTISYHNINRRLRASAGSKQVLLFIKRSLKVFVLIAVVFAVCTLPASIMVILQSLRVYTPSYFVGYVGDIIECIPCVTNVICYLVCSPKFRMEIRKLLSVLRYCNTGEYISKSASAEGAENVDGLDDEKKNKRAIDKTTLKLDWILGDDPSQVVIPGSPTLRVDTPASAVPPDSIEVPLMALETIAEQDETIPRRAARKGTSVNTWPRMRQTPNDRRVPENLAASKDSVFSGSSLNGVDIGVHQSGFETGLSTETVDNIMPKISKHTVKNVEIGTQTEFSRVDVHETVKEGRL